MVGSAVETMVWSSAASSMPSSRAPMETSTLLETCSRSPCAPGRGPGSVSAASRTSPAMWTSTDVVTLTDADVHRPSCSV